MPNISLARQRFVAYYLQLAKDNRKDLSKVGSDLINLLQAADFCVELSDWPSLWELTAAINDYLLRQDWKVYIKFNALLVTNYPADQMDGKTERLGQLAELEELQGNYSEVLRWSKILVHLHAQDPNHNNAAAIKALKKISRLTAASGSYDEAMEYLMQGISIARDGLLSKDEVDLLFELSLLYKKRLDINIVRELSIESLRIARSIGYFTKEVDILSLLASIHVLQNQLEAALNLYAQVLASVRAMGDTVREDAIVAEITQVRRLIKLEEDRKRKIFISYNHEDRSFVHRLVSDLKDRELLVWWDEWEIKVGDSIIQKVSDGISESAYLMAVLSPNSVKSEWVQREIGSVLMKQLSVDKNITILPLLLAECDVPVLLREIKFADFRKDYQSGLQSLLAVFLASAS